jgi:PAS domain S-box-containing protein
LASPAIGKQTSASGEAAKGRCWGKLLSTFFDQLHTAMFVTDLDGNIRGGNPALLVISGYSEDDLLGRHLSNLCPEEEDFKVRNTVLAAVRERGHYQGELRARHKSGKDLWLHLSLTLLTDEQSVPAGIAGVTTDVTEEKALDLALRQAREKRFKSSDAIPQALAQQLGVAERAIGDTQFLIASPVMHKFMAMVDRVAAHREIVLITGETGSGKELIARSVHDNSPRKDKPWVDINCAALPEHLVESELFGYEKGAFSGADSSKPGLFELADKGTLFLDEIGELDLKLQVKLLRVLDGAPYYRLGGHRKITVDVRVVAATNQNLEAAVEEGRFRRDLFHRLGQFQLRVPPLRERPEDIIALSQHFLARKDSRLFFSPDALSALACYSWRGNVRELRNLMAKLAMGVAGPEITADDLLAEISVEKQRKAEAAMPAMDLDGMEEQMIIKALEKTGGHRGLAAEQLGISRRTLSRKLREYKITCPEGERGRGLGSLGSDQQKFYRAKTQFIVSLNSETDNTTVTAVNLSSGGLGVDGLTDPQRFSGLLECSFLLPETEILIQAKVRVVWADAAGRAGLRFVVLEPAMYQEIHHWTARQMKEEGWDLPE